MHGSVNFMIFFFRIPVKLCWGDPVLLVTSPGQDQCTGNSYIRSRRLNPVTDENVALIDPADLY